MAYPKSNALHKHHLKQKEHHLKLAAMHEKHAQKVAGMVELKETHHVAKKRGRPSKKG